MFVSFTSCRIFCLILLKFRANHLQLLRHPQLKDQMQTTSLIRYLFLKYFVLKGQIQTEPFELQRDIKHILFLLQIIFETPR